MGMKDGVREILGRTIRGVIVKEGENPDKQLFLILTDGSYYEFYGTDIWGTSSVDPGGAGAVRRYISRDQVTYEAHPGP